MNSTTTTTTTTMTATGSSSHRTATMSSNTTLPYESSPRQSAVPARLLVTTLIVSIAVVLSMGQQDAYADGNIMVIEPIKVQQVGASPQGMMIDSTGNLVYSNGVGTSIYRDPWTFAPIGSGNVGGINGLDHNLKNGMHAGSNGGGFWGFGVEPNTSTWEYHPSGLGFAHAIFLQNKYVGVFGQQNGIEGMRIFDFDGNQLASTDFNFDNNWRIQGASANGSNKFGGSVWELDTLDSYFINADYAINGSDINFSNIKKFRFEGFEEGFVYGGFHQDDNNNVWAGVVNMHTGQNFLLRGQLPKSLCSADLNNDGVVNVSDLLMMLGTWGTCDKPYDCPADLNGDGVVNVSDLLIMLGTWGPCQR